MKKKEITIDMLVEQCEESYDEGALSIIGMIEQENAKGMTPANIFKHMIILKDNIKKGKTKIE